MVNVTKKLVKAMNLFVKHRTLRTAYYVGIGAGYLFAASSLVQAIAALIDAL